jgi:hypothetical protein
MMAPNDLVTDVDVRNSHLNSRYLGMAWALFLIMTGTLWLLPRTLLPDGLWFLGVGLILLGLNVARIMNDVETSGLTVILGLLAISIGLGKLLELSISAFPLLLIGLGGLMVMHSILTRYAERQQPESHTPADRII